MTSLLAGPDLSHFSHATGTVLVGTYPQPLGQEPDANLFYRSRNREASATSQPIKLPCYANLPGYAVPLGPFGFWPYGIQLPYSFRGADRYSVIALCRWYQHN